MTASRGAEDWHVPETEDYPDLVRTYWTCTHCPQDAKCSASSWAKCQSWSLISEDRLKMYVKQHLIKSGLHDLKPDEAATLVEQADIVELQDTYEDRQKLRPRKRPACPSWDPPLSALKSRALWDKMNPFGLFKACLEQATHAEHMCELCI